MTIDCAPLLRRVRTRRGFKQLVSAMQTYSETVRFEILVDGERRCVTGIDGLGVLSVTVDWVMRDPGQKPEDCSLEDWSRQKLRVLAGGLRTSQSEHVYWLSEDLTPGNEITIRILGPGEMDAPMDSHT